MESKTKEEKDAELDRRIEALRKKNQALVRRYQEIEEDKKKAELEGIAVTTPRKPRPHDPELEKRSRRRRTSPSQWTCPLHRSEKRVVNDNKPGAPEGPKGQSPSKRTSGRVGRGPRGECLQERSPREGEPGEIPARRGGRGEGEFGDTPGRREGRGEGESGDTPGRMRRRGEGERQNIEKMNEEMEKIAEYERGQDKPSRHFLDDPRRSGPAPDLDRKEGSRRHVRNWGGLDFDNVKTGPELEREWTSRRPGPKGSVDMTMSMTGRERAEYLRWKKEREQIDEERLARHRNATGQWRREWDAQKSDNM
uniref:Coiled-coil domain containing 9 n=1 Tax=Neogobius melanostomus TaxID=47308 RepID=A0A8C6U603_9GOBI